MHELRRANAPVFAGERGVLHVAVLVFVKPGGLEGERVHQVQEGAGGYLVQDARDHAVRVVVRPGVDVFERGVVEGRQERPRVVIVGIGLQKRGFHGEVPAVFDPEGVREVQAAAFLVGEVVRKRAQIGVELPDGQAERAFHLGKRLALRPVGGHAERVQGRKRRHEHAFLAGGALLEQPHREVGDGFGAGPGRLDVRGRGGRRGGFRAVHEVLGRDGAGASGQAEHRRQGEQKAEGDAERGGEAPFRGFRHGGALPSGRA